MFARSAADCVCQVVKVENGVSVSSKNGFEDDAIFVHCVRTRLGNAIRSGTVSFDRELSSNLRMGAVFLAMK